MEKYHLVTLNNLEYVVFDFKYASIKVNGVDVFFLLGRKNIKVKDPKIGEIYIRVPSWVEMQDLFQSSCQYNIMTKEYDVNEDFYRDNKIIKICSKIVDADGNITVMNKWVCEKLPPLFGQLIIEKVDEIIGVYYIGTGLSKEEEEKLSFDCFKYYSSIYKMGAGKNVVIPPVPIPVLLMNICKAFNCTPDIARKICKRDIDMTMIAKEQENICKNPSLIGLA